MNETAPDKSMAIPPDLISVSDAARLAGWSQPWLVRQMNSAGVCRIGQHLDYQQFKAFFRQRAQRRQTRIVGRSRPAIMFPKSVGAKANTAKELVTQLLGKAGS